MHQNNRHIAAYNLDELTQVYPDLLPFVYKGKSGRDTINFSDPKAVKLLNKALLQKHYAITYWDFPDASLCPPIPGRVDYIHYLNDLLQGSKTSQPIRILDIGTGATCIYPLLGYSVYKWEFVGTDVDGISVINARTICNQNSLDKVIEIRKQVNNYHIFKGVVKEKEQFAASMCNPPFYKSEEEANIVHQRKKKNLKLDSNTRNFSGKSNELWYKGGEKAFIHNYLHESVLYKEQVVWFTILVSNKDLVRGIKVSLKKLGVTSVKVIPMQLGHKKSRILAWSFVEHH